MERETYVMISERLGHLTDGEATAAESDFRSESPADVLRRRLEPPTTNPEP